LISLLIVVVAAMLFGVIAYRYSQIRSGPGTPIERLRRSEDASVSKTHRRIVLGFSIVSSAIILVQSSASWPLKIGIFVGFQVFAVASLAAVKSFYEDH
jgi:hypothetical protein